jgi:PrtD family type I secretion system ABC transporter
MDRLLASPLKRFLLLAAGASFLLNAALLAPALYMLQVFDRVFASRSLETLLMLSLMAAVALWLGYCLDAVRARTLAWVGRTLDRQLSPAALREALRGVASSADHVTERLRDIQVLRSFLGGQGVQALFDAPWLPLFLLVIAGMHPVMGLAAALGAALLLALAVATERLTAGHATSAQQQGRTAARHADQLDRHAEVIAGMGMAAAAIAQWQLRHEAALQAQEQLAGPAARLAALARALRQAVQVGVLGVGAWLVVGAQASPGIMVAATILLGRALQPVEHLIGGWRQWVDARKAWQRLTASLVDLPGAAAMPLPRPAGRLQVERVVYGVDAARPVLIKGVSFSLEPGESLGIVGPSAAGKSTLLRLLLGLRKPAAGVVRLDGADVSQWDRDDLGPHLGYLPQDVTLLAGSVAQNIARLGPVDATRVVKAARRARVHEMILRLPQGYETQVGEGGLPLSGGQRQRIGLARALYGEPALVVLDEPDAHLDAEGEAALAAAMLDLKNGGATVVVVGHRPALMAQLDKLAVLKDGALDAFGPTASVLARLAGAQAKAVAPLPSTASRELAA